MYGSFPNDEQQLGSHVGGQFWEFEHILGHCN